jgi:hypothetical protein
MGSTVGPVANRLRDGKFSIASESFAIDVNELDRANLLTEALKGCIGKSLNPRPATMVARLRFL